MLLFFLNMHPGWNGIPRSKHTSGSNFHDQRIPAPYWIKKKIQFMVTGTSILIFYVVLLLVTCLVLRDGLGLDIKMDRVLVTMSIFKLDYKF
jgi:hypothetical protein